MDACPAEQSLALAAASQAATALRELLAFARDGEHSDTHAFEEEVVCLLADALKMAMEIEAERLPANAERFGYDAEMTGLFKDLQALLGRFLEGWA